MAVESAITEHIGNSDWVLDYGKAKRGINGERPMDNKTVNSCY